MKDLQPTSPRTVKYDAIAIDALSIAYREAGDPAESETGVAARLSGLVASVSQPSTGVSRQVSCHRTGLSWLWEQRHARSGELCLHL